MTKLHFGGEIASFSLVFPGEWAVTETFEVFTFKGRKWRQLVLSCPEKVRWWADKKKNEVAAVARVWDWPSQKANKILKQKNQRLEKLGQAPV